MADTCMHGFFDTETFATATLSYAQVEIVDSHESNTLPDEQKGARHFTSIVFDWLVDSEKYIEHEDKYTKGF